MEKAFLDDAFATNIVDELPPDLTAQSGVPADLADSSLVYCEVCGKDDFKNARGLKLHMSRMHGMGADKTPSGQSKKKSKATETLRQDVEMLLMAMGIGVAALNEEDGATVIKGSPNLAKALANASEKNPKLRSFLEKLTTGAAYTELVIAVSAIVLPILANHNLLPAKLAVAMAGVAETQGADTEQASMWQ